MVAAHRGPDGRAPDYTTYDLDELRDALRHVDATRFPDRAEALRRELRLRAAGPEGAAERAESRRWERRSTQLAATPLVEDPGWVLRAVGIVVATSGAWTLVALGVARPAADDMLQAAVLGGVLLLYVSTLGAGVWTAARPHSGVHPLRVLLVAQLPLVQLGRFGYAVTTAPTIELKLWPRAGAAVDSGFLCQVWWFEEAQPSYFGVNLVALVALLFLTIAAHSLRRERALLARASMVETFRDDAVELDVERRRVRIDGEDAFGFEDVEAVTITRVPLGENEDIAVWIKPRGGDAVRFAHLLRRWVANRLATEVAETLGVDNVRRLG